MLHRDVLSPHGPIPSARLIPLVVLSLCLLFGHAVSQTPSITLTGMLRNDLFILAPELSPGTAPIPITAPGESTGHKSVWLAGGLSAILPGAGQIYAEAPWWRTALYGVIEAAAWSAFLIYDSKGETATREFEEFADRHWNVVRYVEWIESNYLGWGEDAVDREKAAEALASIYRSHDVSLDPWERIDFDALNKLEKAVRGGFSHTLPPHGDQQYYEEIGKYVQYRAGWDDHDATADTLLYAPMFTTAHNFEYVDQRDRANRYLDYASWGVGALLANHLVSMVDAALEARGYNIRMATHFRSIERPDGTTTPSGSLEIRIGY